MIYKRGASSEVLDSFFDTMSKFNEKNRILVKEASPKVVELLALFRHASSMAKPLANASTSLGELGLKSLTEVVTAAKVLSKVPPSGGVFTKALLPGGEGGGLVELSSVEEAMVNAANDLDKRIVALETLQKSEDVGLSKAERAALGTAIDTLSSHHAELSSKDFKSDVKAAMAINAYVDEAHEIIRNTLPERLKQAAQGALEAGAGAGVGEGAVAPTYNLLGRNLTFELRGPEGGQYWGPKLDKNHFNKIVSAIKAETAGLVSVVEGSSLEGLALFKPDSHKALLSDPLLTSSGDPHTAYLYHMLHVGEAESSGFFANQIYNNEGNNLQYLAFDALYKEGFDLESIFDSLVKYEDLVGKVDAIVGEGTLVGGALSRRKVVPPIEDGAAKPEVPRDLPETPALPREGYARADTAYTYDSTPEGAASPSTRFIGYPTSASPGDSSIRIMDLPEGQREYIIGAIEGAGNRPSPVENLSTEPRMPRDRDSDFISSANDGSMDDAFRAINENTAPLGVPLWQRGSIKVETDFANGLKRELPSFSMSDHARDPGLSVEIQDVLSSGGVGNSVRLKVEKRNLGALSVGLTGVEMSMERRPGLMGRIPGRRKTDRVNIKLTLGVKFNDDYSPPGYLVDDAMFRDAWSSLTGETRGERAAKADLSDAKADLETQEKELKAEMDRQVELVNSPGADWADRTENLRSIRDKEELIKKTIAEIDDLQSKLDAFDGAPHRRSSWDDVSGGLVRNLGIAMEEAIYGIDISLIESLVLSEEFTTRLASHVVGVQQPGLASGAIVKFDGTDIVQTGAQDARFVRYPNPSSHPVGAGMGYDRPIVDGDFEGNTAILGWEDKFSIVESKIRGRLDESTKTERIFLAKLADIQTVLDDTSSVSRLKGLNGSRYSVRLGNGASTGDLARILFDLGGYENRFYKEWNTYYRSEALNRLIDYNALKRGVAAYAKGAEGAVDDALRRMLRPDSLPLVKEDADAYLVATEKYQKFMSGDVSGGAKTSELIRELHSSFMHMYEPDDTAKRLVQSILDDTHPDLSAALDPVYTQHGAGGEITSRINNIIEVLGRESLLKYNELLRAARDAKPKEDRFWEVLERGHGAKVDDYSWHPGSNYRPFAGQRVDANGEAWTDPNHPNWFGEWYGQRSITISGYDESSVREFLRLSVENPVQTLDDGTEIGGETIRLIPPSAKNGVMFSDAKAAQEKAQWLGENPRLPNIPKSPESANAAILDQFGIYDAAYVRASILNHDTMLSEVGSYEDIVKAAGERGINGGQVRADISLAHSWSKIKSYWAALQEAGVIDSGLSIEGERVIFFEAPGGAGYWKFGLSDGFVFKVRDTMLNGRRVLEMKFEVLKTPTAEFRQQINFAAELMGESGLDLAREGTKRINILGVERDIIAAHIFQLPSGNAIRYTVANSGQVIWILPPGQTLVKDIPSAAIQAGSVKVHLRILEKSDSTGFSTHRMPEKNHPTMGRPGLDLGTMVDDSADTGPDKWQSQRYPEGTAPTEADVGHLFEDGVVPDGFPMGSVTRSGATAHTGYFDDVGGGAVKDFLYSGGLGPLMKKGDDGRVIFDPKTLALPPNVTVIVNENTGAVKFVFEDGSYMLWGTDNLVESTGSAYAPLGDDRLMRVEIAHVEDGRVVEVTTLGSGERTLRNRNAYGQEPFFADTIAFRKKLKETYEKFKKDNRRIAIGNPDDNTTRLLTPLEVDVRTHKQIVEWLIEQGEQGLLPKGAISAEVHWHFSQSRDPKFDKYAEFDAKLAEVEQRVMHSTRDRAGIENGWVPKELDLENILRVKMYIDFINANPTIFSDIRVELNLADHGAQIDEGGKIRIGGVDNHVIESGVTKWLPPPESALAKFGAYERQLHTQIGNELQSYQHSGDRALFSSFIDGDAQAIPQTRASLNELNRVLDEFEQGGELGQSAKTLTEDHQTWLGMMLAGKVAEVGEDTLLEFNQTKQLRFDQRTLEELSEEFATGKLSGGPVELGGKMPSSQLNSGKLGVLKGMIGLTQMNIDHVDRILAAKKWPNGVSLSEEDVAKLTIYRDEAFKGLNRLFSEGGNLDQLKFYITTPNGKLIQTAEVDDINRFFLEAHPANPRNIAFRGDPAPTANWKNHMTMMAFSHEVVKWNMHHYIGIAKAQIESLNKVFSWERIYQAGGSNDFWKRIQKLREDRDAGSIDIAKYNAGLKEAVGFQVTDKYIDDLFKIRVSFEQERASISKWLDFAVGTYSGSLMPKSVSGMTDFKGPMSNGARGFDVGFADSNGWFLSDKISFVIDPETLTISSRIGQLHEIMQQIDRLAVLADPNKISPYVTLSVTGGRADDAYGDVLYSTDTSSLNPGDVVVTTGEKVLNMGDNPDFDELARRAVDVEGGYMIRAGNAIATLFGGGASPDGMYTHELASEMFRKEYMALSKERQAAILAGKSPEYKLKALRSFDDPTILGVIGTVASGALDVVDRGHAVWVQMLHPRRKERMGYPFGDRGMPIGADPAEFPQYKKDFHDRVKELQSTGGTFKTGGGLQEGKPIGWAARTVGCLFGTAGLWMFADDYIKDKEHYELLVALSLAGGCLAGSNGISGLAQTPRFIYQEVRPWALRLGKPGPNSTRSPGISVAGVWATAQLPIVLGFASMSLCAVFKIMYDSGERGYFSSLRNFDVSSKVNKASGAIKEYMPSGDSEVDDHTSHRSARIHALNQLVSLADDERVNMPSGVSGEDYGRTYKKHDEGWCIGDDFFSGWNLVMLVGATGLLGEEAIRDCVESFFGLDDVRQLMILPDPDEDSGEEGSGRDRSTQDVEGRIGDTYWGRSLPYIGGASDQYNNVPQRTIDDVVRLIRKHFEAGKSDINSAITAYYETGAEIDVGGEDDMDKLVKDIMLEIWPTELESSKSQADYVFPVSTEVGGQELSGSCNINAIWNQDIYGSNGNEYGPNACAIVKDLDPLKLTEGARSAMDRSSAEAFNYFRGYLEGQIVQMLNCAAGNFAEQIDFKFGDILVQDKYRPPVRRTQDEIAAVGGKAGPLKEVMEEFPPGGTDTAQQDDEVPASYVPPLFDKQDKQDKQERKRQ